MQTKTGIIFLHKDKFDLYSPYLPTILQFQFVPELIQDFDLVNRELLDNLIRVFLLNNKIPASNMMIIIADDASFMKDFIVAPVPVPNPANPPQGIQDPSVAPPTLEDIQDQANHYLEHVPFENVASRTFPLANGVRAYATNQDIYDVIKFVFEKHGFIIEFVIPGFTFGQEINAKPFLDGATVTAILQKFNVLGEYNLLKKPLTGGDITFAEEVDEKEVSPTSEKEKQRLIIGAIGGIILLFAITGGILYWQFANPPYKAPVSGTPPANTVVISPNPTAVATIPLVTPSLTESKELTVQIVGSSSSVQQAQSLRTLLTPYGFKSIDIQTQDTLAAASPLLVFSSTVGSQAKLTITQEVKKVFANVLVQEKADLPFDIMITLGR